jgi:hypothetical protein
MDSEATMKKKLELVLLLALCSATVGVTAAAQNTGQINGRGDAKINNLVYDPSQSAALLRQVDWDDHHRCDGNHDRDDRHCYWGDGDRYRPQFFYGGNAYYGNAPAYQSGWYDNHGRWHAGPAGWYDRKGKWHSEKHGHGEDR